MRKPIMVIASLMLAITALASPIGKTMGDVIDIPILNPEDLLTLFTMSAMSMSSSRTCLPVNLLSFTSILQCRPSSPSVGVQATGELPLHWEVARSTKESS